MAESISGSCLCGAVRFTIGAPVTELRACHCKDCQKVSGSFGTVNAIVPAEAFKITKGTPRRYEKTADSGRVLYRHFCGDCGAPIYSFRAATPERVVVRAGAFDGAGPMKITGNIWTKSAREWAHIDPASKQFPGSPD